MNYIVANWKSNKKFDEVWVWFDEFGKQYQPRPEHEIVVAPPFPFVFEASKKLKELDLDRVSLGVQDVSPFPFGAYTGAVSVGMVAEVVNYAIVGHSERREYFHETHQEIANKVEQLHEAGVMPILCVDAPYAREQIAALRKEDLDKLIVAYEPLEAIGSGTPQEPEEVKRVVDEIAEYLPESTPILYGGSVKPDNAHIYLGIEGVNGLLIGGASLDPGKFATLAKQA